jgi:hypothetical protein
VKPGTKEKHEFKIEVAEEGENKTVQKTAFEVEQSNVEQHKRRPEKKSISSTIHDAKRDEQKKNCTLQ